MRSLLCLFAVAVLTGCSNLCLESTDRRTQLQPAQVVFVTNPELSREFEILQRSKVYQLASQPDEVGRLTLKPIGMGGGCGLGMFVTVYTLGIVPVKMPGRYMFQYSLEIDGTVEHRMHHLPVYARISIWDAVLKPFHNEERVLAKALARAPAWRSSGDPERWVPVNPEEISPKEPPPTIQRPKGPL